MLSDVPGRLLTHSQSLSISLLETSCRLFEISMRAEEEVRRIDLEDVEVFIALQDPMSRASAPKIFDPRP